MAHLEVEAVEDEDEESLGGREDREQGQEDQLDDALREQDHEETKDPRETCAHELCVTRRREQASS